MLRKLQEISYHRGLAIFDIHKGRETIMKRLTLAVVVIAGIATSATVALAGPGAGTGINGSMHDLNADIGMQQYAHDALERTCVFCHTPHNALSGKTDNLSPLWNHADSKLAVMAPYAWVAPTNKGIAFASDPLIGPSRLCMACHDGSTAVDAHGSANGIGTPTTGGTPMNAAYNDALKNIATRFITDLTVTHPIGFLYDEAVTKRPNELIPKTSGFLTTAPVGSSWDTHKRVDGSNKALGTSAKKIQDTLYGTLDSGGNGGYMTCATCHDVHNSVNATPDGSHQYNYFLYAKEEGSAICLSCHIK